MKEDMFQKQVTQVQNAFLKKGSETTLENINTKVCNSVTAITNPIPTEQCNSGCASNSVDNLIEPDNTVLTHANASPLIMNLRFVSSQSCVNTVKDVMEYENEAPLSLLQECTESDVYINQFNAVQIETNSATAEAFTDQCNHPELMHVTAVSIPVSSLSVPTQSANTYTFANNSCFTAPTFMYSSKSSTVCGSINSNSIVFSHLRAGNISNSVMINCEYFTQPYVNSVSCASSDTFYTTACQETTSSYLSSFVESVSSEEEIPFEIIGDNFDLTISPSYMTSEKQRRSLHWFLNVGIQRRVIGLHLPDNEPKADILTVPNADFLPTPDDLYQLESNFTFHIIKTMVKYLEFLQPYTPSVPSCIPHPYMEETSQKSKFLNCELIEKSENDSEGIIHIIQQIHKNYIPHTSGDNPKVLRQIVFGGDVLTNERAYTAQTSMRNSDCDYDALAGIIHRPEGLHRVMNSIRVETFDISLIVLHAMETDLLHAPPPSHNISFQV